MISALDLINISVINFYFKLISKLTFFNIGFKNFNVLTRNFFSSKILFNFVSLFHGFLTLVNVNQHEITFKNAILHQLFLNDVKKTSRIFKSNIIILI